jgi:hypothetical protein
VASAGEIFPVELSGTLAAQGLARGFSWFLTTALPPRPQMTPETRAILADFLEASGERGAAGRLRQF